ncbi:hypothetical protein GCM10020218_001580 [Dactylosporangium vinaceum]
MSSPGGLLAGFVGASIIATIASFIVTGLLLAILGAVVAFLVLAALAATTAFAYVAAFTVAKNSRDTSWVAEVCIAPILALAATACFFAIDPTSDAVRAWWLNIITSAGYDPENLHWPWWMIVVGIIGGLLGIVLVFGAPYLSARALASPRRAWRIGGTLLLVAATVYWSNVLAYQFSG